MFPGQPRDDSDPGWPKSAAVSVTVTEAVTVAVAEPEAAAESASVTATDAVNCRADLSIVMTLNSKVHRIATLTLSGWVAVRERPAYSPESPHETRRLFIVFGPGYGRDRTPTVTARCRSPRDDRIAGRRATI